MKLIVALLLGFLLFAGCRSPSITQTAEGQNTTYSGKNGVDGCAITIDHKTGEVRLENEPRTLSQLAKLSDGIYRETILPKLNDGEPLDEGELTLLVCCLNARMSKLNAANTLVLQSMQLESEESLTYDMVAHPRIVQRTDFQPAQEAAERRREASEVEFKKCLDDLVAKDVTGDTQFRESVTKWGETFSGDDSVTFNKSAREKVLRQILSDENWDYRYLQKGFWWTLWSFFFWNKNTHKKGLPQYRNRYENRAAYIDWREEYQENHGAVSWMYDELRHAAEKNAKNGKGIQNDRLEDVVRQFADRANSLKKSDLLVFDYPFAMTLLECMRMMDYYDRNEWCNVTLNEVKERRYKPLARSLVAYTNSLRMEKINHAGLKRLYEKVYVPFLGNAFDMTSKELYRGDLIPFSVDSEFDLKSVKEDVRKKRDKDRSAMEVIAEDGMNSNE